MKHDVDQHIRSTLSKNHACYILITCDEPTEDGEMQVEMTYEGDLTVAAYLLEGAKTFIAQQQDPDEDSAVNALPSTKIHHL
jgi:hypothetical protein